MNYPIIIVGAGASGIGMGVLLKRLKLPFSIIDKGEVGQSFVDWAKETRFISPSFTGNSFGSVDLNSVTPDTSPAFSLRSEHPSGTGYAQYLKSLAKHFKLPIKNNVTVESIQYDKNEKYSFTLQTSKGEMRACYVVWAAGEYQYPNHNTFEGAELCTHYSEVDSWRDLEGDDFSVIGGYESGVDASFQLSILHKSVRLFDGGDSVATHGSDSSYSLSPFTRDRLRVVKDRIDVIGSHVIEVEKDFDIYTIRTSDGKSYTSPTPPINCTGFSSSLTLVEDMFEFDNGHPLLTDTDESTLYPNLFLTGPQVKHGNALFCFIYKYRQRFGIIGEQLSERFDGDAELRESIIDYYRKNQFYLDDLSCCEDECSC